MMKLLPIPLLVLAAACGQASPSNQAAIASRDGADREANAVSGEAPSAAAAADSEAPPRPSDVKTFRDWSVACDNGKTCEAVSLAPGEGSLQDIGIIVRRPAGPNDAVSISLRATREQSGAVEVLADGQRVAGSTLDEEGLAVFDSNASARIAAVLPSARSLTVRGAGAETATISVNGASAALRYMDAEQGRAGTKTALVAKGDQPLTARAPALPLIVAAPLARGDAVKPSPALIAEMRRTSNCPADEFGTPGEEAFPLSARDTLVLISCGSGAYNAFTAPFIVTDGKARPAPSDHSYSIGEERQGLQLVNGGWNPATGRLSSYAKARGLGDCGDAREWVWDSRQFRLVMAETEGNCRGAVKWLRTWTARVERGG